MPSDDNNSCGSSKLPQIISKVVAILFNLTMDQYGDSCEEQTKDIILVQY